MSNVNTNWEEESRRFDEAADYYDKFRPSYPKELIDCIIDSGIVIENNFAQKSQNSLLNKEIRR